MPMPRKYATPEEAKEAKRIKIREYHKREGDRLHAAGTNVAAHRGLTGLAAAGFVTPSKVRQDEPLGIYVLSKMVAQIGGSPSMLPGFYSVGDGCYMKRRIKSLS